MNCLKFFLLVRHRVRIKPEMKQLYISLQRAFIYMNPNRSVKGWFPWVRDSLSLINNRVPNISLNVQINTRTIYLGSDNAIGSFTKTLSELLGDTMIDLIKDYRQLIRITENVFKTIMCRYMNIIRCLRDSKTWRDFLNIKIFLVTDFFTLYLFTKNVLCSI